MVSSRLKLILESSLTSVVSSTDSTPSPDHSSSESVYCNLKLHLQNSRSSVIGGGKPKLNKLIDLVLASI